MHLEADLMDPRWEIFLYAIVVIPAVIFVILYLIVWGRIRHTPESWHLLMFTAVLAVIAVEVGARNIWHLWHRSDGFFAVVMVAAAGGLWQRLYMLIKYTAVPALRATRESRRSRAAR